MKKSTSYFKTNTYKKPPHISNCLKSSFPITVEKEHYLCSFFLHLLFLPWKFYLSLFRIHRIPLFCIPRYLSNTVLVSTRSRINQFINQIKSISLSFYYDPAILFSLVWFEVNEVMLLFLPLHSKRENCQQHVRNFLEVCSGKST